MPHRPNPPGSGWAPQTSPPETLPWQPSRGGWRVPPDVGVNCNGTQRGAVLYYGEAFLQALAPVDEEPRNGYFITSCICHSCDWAQLARGGKSALGHYSDWFHGRSVASGARTVDPRGPNGDGALGRGVREPGWANCSDGFYPPSR